MDILADVELSGCSGEPCRGGARRGFCCAGRAVFAQKIGFLVHGWGADREGQQGRTGEVLEVSRVKWCPG